MYVGSGEGLLRPDLSVGNGIYRSGDGGRDLVASRPRRRAADPGSSQSIRAIPNRVFAAVLGHPYGPSSERGIYRSLDGGASWQRVLYRMTNTGGSAVVIDPAQPADGVRGAVAVTARPLGGQERVQGHRRRTLQVERRRQHLEAAHGRTARRTWRRSTSPSRRARPSGCTRRVGTTEPGDYSSAAGLGLFRSDDGGENWARITQRPAAGAAHRRRRSAGGARRPHQSRRCLQHRARDHEVQRRRQDLAVAARRTRWR